MAKPISSVLTGTDPITIKRGFYALGMLNSGKIEAEFNGVPMPAGTSNNLPMVAGQSYEIDLVVNPNGSTLITHEIR